MKENISHVVKPRRFTQLIAVFENAARRQFPFPCAERADKGVRVVDCVTAVEVGKSSADKLDGSMDLRASEGNSR